MGVFGRIRRGPSRTKQQIVERFEDLVADGRLGRPARAAVDVETIEALEELLDLG